ncbi:uncharacterized protein [Anabrus simplex]|uniref:uncharacterized protein n=1 Tax=Anabrus simplex TaxID=316456 RepID=UPI0035A3C5A9
MGKKGQAKTVSSEPLPTQKDLEVRSLSISNTDGPILGSYSLMETLVMVQVNKIFFWHQKLGNWVFAGEVKREPFETATMLGNSAGGVTDREQSGVLYVELWMCRNGSVSILKASCYYYSAKENVLKHTYVDLESVLGEFRDVLFCILDDLSLFVCWSSTSVTSVGNTVYQGNVKKYLLDWKLDKTLVSKDFMFTACTLKHLSCIGDSKSHVLGWSGQLLFLWNHMDCNDWTSLRLNHPGSETRLKSSYLHWATLKQDNLFVVFEVDKCLEFKMVHLKTASRKLICQFIIPESYERMVGAVMVEDKLVATFSNGAVCWSLQSFNLLAESEIKDAKRVFLGVEHIIIIGASSAIKTVPVEDCTKNSLCSAK